jgi:dienelactone hydrolase
MIDNDNMAGLTRRLRDANRFELNFDGNRLSFEEWRRTTREQVLETTGLTHATSAQSEEKGRWQGDGYSGRLLTLDFSNGEAADAFLLLPDSDRPCPAVILFHDHGSTFEIGKEKSILPPPGDPHHDEALAWVERIYGGRHVGDALAKRGFAVLSVDALGWGSRKGNGYEAQQALAANLLQFGVSLASVVAFEDIEAINYLARRPDIDPKRIAAFGFSFGGYRAWQAAALSDKISVFFTGGWMGHLQGLMQSGNNQLRGQSALYMLHPQIAGRLDYPDFAALAAPKPALFFSGVEDRHFPRATAQAAFERMHAIWTAAGSPARLETSLQPTGHIFPVEQQDAAIAWLSRQLHST